MAKGRKKTARQTLWSAARGGIGVVWVYIPEIFPAVFVSGYCAQSVFSPAYTANRQKVLM